MSSPIGMRVPKGGSSCAKCKFWDAEDDSCNNEEYINAAFGKKQSRDARFIDAKTGEVVTGDEYCCNFFDWEQGKSAGLKQMTRAPEIYTEPEEERDETLSEDTRRDFPELYPRRQADKKHDDLDLPDPEEHHPRAPAGMSTNKVTGEPELRDDPAPLNWKKDHLAKNKTAAFVVRIPRKRTQPPGEYSTAKEALDAAHALMEANPHLNQVLTMDTETGEYVHTLIRERAWKVKYPQAAFREANTEVRVMQNETKYILSFPNMERRAWAKRPYFTHNWFQDLAYAIGQVQGELLAKKDHNYIEAAFKEQSTATRFISALRERFQVPVDRIKFVAECVEQPTNIKSAELDEKHASHLKGQLRLVLSENQDATWQEAWDTVRTSWPLDFPNIHAAEVKDVLDSLKERKLGAFKAMAVVYLKDRRGHVLECDVNRARVQVRFVDEVEPRWVSAGVLTTVQIQPVLWRQANPDGAASQRSEERYFEEDRSTGDGSEDYSFEEAEERRD